MRASVFIATSLDGFIAREDGSLDWLPADGGEPHGYTEFMDSVDALVIGRKTFEAVLSFAAWPYGKKPVIVLTSKPADIVPPADAVCEAMAASPREVVTRLAARGIEHVYVDGGLTIQRFLEARLIQRVIITRVPVLLGRGIPLFGTLAHDIRFEHIATRSYASGLVQSEYLVLPAGQPA